MSPSRPQPGQGLGVGAGTARTPRGGRGVPPRRGYRDIRLLTNAYKLWGESTNGLYASHSVMKRTGPARDRRYEPRVSMTAQATEGRCVDNEHRSVGARRFGRIRSWHDRHDRHSRKRLRQSRVPRAARELPISIRCSTAMCMAFEEILAEDVPLCCEPADGSLVDNEADSSGTDARRPDQGPHAAGIPKCAIPRRCRIIHARPAPPRRMAAAEMAAITNDVWARRGTKVLACISHCDAIACSKTSALATLWPAAHGYDRVWHRTDI